MYAGGEREHSLHGSTNERIPIDDSSASSVLCGNLETPLPCNRALRNGCPVSFGSHVHTLPATSAPDDTQYGKASSLVKPTVWMLACTPQSINLK